MGERESLTEKESESGGERERERARNRLRKKEKEPHRLVKKAINEHTEYNTAELDRSRPVKQGAATRRRLGERLAVIMHTMGTGFVGKLRGVRQIAEAQIGEGLADME